MGSEGLSEGTVGLSEQSEGLPEGPRGLLEGPEGLLEGSKGHPERPEGLPEGPEGLPEGSEAALGGQTYGWTDGWMDGISPHSTGLCPLSGPLPKKPNIRVGLRSPSVLKLAPVSLAQKNPLRPCQC